MINYDELFENFPEEFAMVEEIQKYALQIVIKPDEPFYHDAVVTFTDSPYPCIQNSQSIITFVMMMTPILSSSFLSAMMLKHRSKILLVV
jgi:hypothetical protein